MRYDIYARLSKDREDQTSTKRQIRDSTRLGESRDWQLAEVHEDVDFSAFRKGVIRPGYERLIQRVKDREVDAVVVWKIDRLARNLREFMRFVDLCDEHGVAFASVNEPFDTSAPIGRAIMQVLAVFAELEGATIGMRVRSARRYAAEQGLPPAGGRRAYGYTPQMEIVPDEADAIRRAADRILEGDSAYTVAKEWNEAGRPTVSGGRWSAPMLLRMLRNPRLVGQRVYKGEVIGPGAWEPILEPATQAALMSKRRAHGTARRTYLLTGLMFCDGCGSKMVGHPDGSTRTYRCPKWPPYRGCGRRIDAAKSEEVIERLTLEALHQPEVLRALQVGRQARSAESETLRKLSEVEQRMTELGEDYAAGLLPRAAFLSASQSLAAESDALSRRLAMVGQRGPLEGVQADKVDAEWKRRDTDWRRRVIESLFERIDVKAGRPGSRFDPGRLAPVPIQ